MKNIKITVLKIDINHELVDFYSKEQITPCPLHKIGDVFTTDFNPPKDFCSWAWNDIQKYVLALLSGGNFSTGFFEGWMNNDNVMIACCTDGLRPVTFKLELIDA